MLPLFSFKPDILGRLADEGPDFTHLPAQGAKLASIYRTRVQSGEVVKIWTQDIFIHSLSQNRVVAFWSICYYRMSQPEEFKPSLSIKQGVQGRKDLLVLVRAAGSCECWYTTGKSIKPSFWLFNKCLVFCNIFKMKSNVFMNFLARSVDSKQFPMLPRCPSDRD